MRHLRYRWLVVLALLLGWAGQAQAGTLYAADGGGGNIANLYILDPTDGLVISTVGSIGFSVTGLAFHPTTGVLYGSTGFKDLAAPGHLITIDLTTGAGTVVGDFIAIANRLDPMADITFDPTTGTLYGWREPTDSLHTIDPTTGAATLVGPSGLPVRTNTYGNGLAANAAGAIFFAGRGNRGHLHTIHKMTGAVTVVATLSGGPGSPGDPIAALAFDETGTLFGINNTGLGSRAAFLVTIDTTTGAITNVGESLIRLDAIAFQPSASPDPNGPPVANAGPDQLAECGSSTGTFVGLSGLGSTDADGDALTYLWNGPFGMTSGPTPTVSLPLGSHSISLTVDDGQGGTASDTVVVTVQDTTPPRPSNVPEPIVVAEAGLMGTPVTVPMPTASDNCGAVTLVSDAPALFPLGVTAVTFTATDPAGNTAVAITPVTVVETPGRMHGHGHIDTEGVRHHFEFKVAEHPNDLGHGRLRYWVPAKRPGHRKYDRDGEDHDGHGKDRFASTAVTAVVFSDSPGINPGRKPHPAVDTVEFAGIGRWNGAPGYTFEARATDAGEPGRGRDTFAVTIRAPDGTTVARVTGTLSGGNIQSLRLHPLLVER